VTGDCRHGDDCRKVHELLGDYLDQDLRDALCAELEKHMDDCPDCRVHVDSVKKVIRLYREAKGDDLPVDIRIRLQDVIARARRGEPGGG
jgi:RNA polymerase sigma-70 factor (ECF subfamily)